ncbi:MAG: M3 family metallopeptidase [Puniceicoccales bacterium]|jgi:oligopeptidase A|nr:M3 family metallopeptidase [Puniceicoccales bacterium]
MSYTFLSAAHPIEWSELTADRLAQDIAEAIAQSDRNIEAICSIETSNVTFSNVIEALERATDPLHTAWGRASMLDSVAGGGDFRVEYNRVLGSVSDFYTSIVLNEKLWERIHAFSCTKEAKTLKGVRKRLFEETMRDFREGGAELPASSKERLRAIRNELAEKTQRYSENLVDATDAWEKIIDNAGELDGMPSSILAVMREDAAQHGHSNAYRLTLRAPIYGPAMRYLKKTSLRKELWDANDRLCLDGKYANGELVHEILRLRSEEAKLLGYKNFADFILSRRMAKNGRTALSFTKKLHNRIEDAFHADIESICSFKAAISGDAHAIIEPWEMAFWSEERCRALYNFDEEQLRPYFELNATLRGLFATVKLLYDIRIEERAVRMSNCGGENGGDIPVWHESVRYFEVFDENGSKIGSFYADFFPREGKHVGAWLSESLGTGHRNEAGEWILPIGVLCTNLTPSTQNRPALLTHNEVQTIFHEFGHLLHHLFGRVIYKSLNGINVAWDFVELPSQIMENWTWERACLDLFARHYESGKPLPKQLFQKMRTTRNYLVAMRTMRQLAMQKMDLDLHISYDGDDLDAFIKRSTQGYTIPYPTEPHSIVRHFHHLFSDSNGYAAAYYSYKWAEVLDADAFERFLEEGIFSRKVADEFRREILEKGNEKSPEKLYRKFRGRDPNLDALLHRCGLK